MSVAHPLWSRQQREWLQALGHPPLVLVGTAVAGANPPLLEVPPPAELANVAMTQMPQARAPVPALPSRLRDAVLRATGLPADEAGKLLQSLGVDAAALRGDPRAKRALWSRLRRLRGSSS